MSRILFSWDDLRLIHRFTYPKGAHSYRYFLKPMRTPNPLPPAHAYMHGQITKECEGRKYTNRSWHFGIDGPWTCVLDPEMLEYGPRFRPKNTQNVLLYMDAANFVCFRAEISGNLGPECSIFGSKVQAHGPTIPKCHVCAFWVCKPVDIYILQNGMINELQLTLATQNKTAMSMLSNLEEQVSQQQMDSQRQSAQCVS